MGGGGVGILGGRGSSTASEGTQGPALAHSLLPTAPSPPAPQLRLVHAVWNESWPEVMLGIQSLAPEVHFHPDGSCAWGLWLGHTVLALPRAEEVLCTEHALQPQRLQGLFNTIDLPFSRGLPAGGLRNLKHIVCSCLLPTYFGTEQVPGWLAIRVHSPGVFVCRDYFGSVDVSPQE